MGSKAAPAQTQESKEVRLPAWVEQASQENYQLAKDVAGRPLEQYGQPTVAGRSDMTSRADQLAQSVVGSTDPWVNQAGGIYGETAKPLDISQFLNPYTAEVERNAISNAERSLQGNLLSVSDAARKAQAFGGSRHGIESAVTRAEGTRGIGDLSAQLRRAGIDFATSTALADRSGRQAAAGGLLSTAGAKKATEAQDISTLYGAGGQEQAQRQAEIDANIRKFEEMRNYPTEQLNIRLAALGMSPYGRTETGSKTSTAEKPGTDWATLGLGALKTGASLWMMSDRDMKTDIERLTGGPIPMYAYRYKGDPKSYPKVVGPMAQDVEKVAPKAVKKVGGKRVIDIHNLLDVLK